MTNTVAKRKRNIIITSLCVLVAAIMAFSILSVSTCAKGYIGESKAKSIALKNAKVKKSKAKFTKVKLDYDDGIRVYDVDFITKTKKYDYEINAKTGKILSKEVKKIAKSSGKKISLAKAKSKALKNANVKKSKAKFIKTKLDYDDGIQVYEIEFTTKNKKYDYEINAKTGRIISKEVKRIAKSSGKNITMAKAKSIALKNANVKKSNAKFIKTKLDYDDGIKVYEIEFKTKNKKYDYEITAKSGKIISKEVKKIANSSGKKITMAKAKSIALKNAGFKSSQVTFTKAKLDYDDGLQVYEIEFYKGHYEYEYEINAKTGKIISKDIDAWG